MALEHIDWPPSDPRWFYMAVQPLRFWAGGDDRSVYVECFRQVGARIDVNMIGRHGQTLLHRVASDGWRLNQPIMTPGERRAFATILLDAGARFDGRDAILQSTPLGWAARWDCAELVELLLARERPAVEKDAEPWATPLAWATRYKHEAIAGMLLEKGAT